MLAYVILSQLDWIFQAKAFFSHHNVPYCGLMSPFLGSKERAISRQVSQIVGASAAQQNNARQTAKTRATTCQLLFLLCDELAR